MSPKGFSFNLIPIEGLRKILKDRHERRKDRDYREAAERERLAIENQKGKLDVAERLLELERKYGPGVFLSEAWRLTWGTGPSLTQELVAVDLRRLPTGETTAPKSNIEPDC
jgi:hypothetical protein